MLGRSARHCGSLIRAVLNSIGESTAPCRVPLIARLMGCELELLQVGQNDLVGTLSKVPLKSNASIAVGECRVAEVMTCSLICRRMSWVMRWSLKPNIEPGMRS